MIVRREEGRRKGGSLVTRERKQHGYRPMLSSHCLLSIFFLVNSVLSGWGGGGEEGRKKKKPLR